ncbi:UBX domain-containing protein 4 [Cyberlindnera fabianii]|uniref:UBX domain-containing protein 4 n=1 Tax=Cyberlindnera fabianii TaxID=36022 RepID=A0A1V2L982_CYBFA|nr:UBX domain-containing protein 4 [Cyberlindnera fabianii]
MSSISVQYGLKTLKVKSTPGMPTSQILENATAHFKLPSADYGLFHNSTELPTSLPLRLQNLPAGVKLTLKPTQAKRSSEATIKIQFINAPSLSKSSVVKKVNTSITLRGLVNDLESEVGKLLNTGLTIKFATFTKAVGEEALDSTLAQIGVDNNGVLRISFTDPNTAKVQPEKPVETSTGKRENALKNLIKKTVPIKTESNPAPAVEASASSSQTTTKDQPTPTKTHPLPSTATTSDVPEPQPLPTPEVPTQYTTQTTENDKMDVDEPTPLPAASTSTSEPTPSLEEQPQHVYVFKPATAEIEHVNPDESEYDLTVSQARQYQDMLSRRANEPEKLRRLRLEQQKKALVNVECRIRFPDNSNVQVNFKPDDTCSQLYEFVKGVIARQGESFELVIPYPQQVLKDGDEKLRNYLGSRNLLLFKCDRKVGVFLKDEFLQQAKEITEAEELKLEREGYNAGEEKEDESKIKGGVLPKKSNGKVFGSGSSEKKVPKWLKIGKK